MQYVPRIVRAQEFNPEIVTAMEGLLGPGGRPIVAQAKTEKSAAWSNDLDAFETDNKPKENGTLWKLWLPIATSEREWVSDLAVSDDDSKSLLSAAASAYLQIGARDLVSPNEKGAFLLNKNETRAEDKARAKELVIIEAARVIELVDSIEEIEAVKQGTLPSEAFAQFARPRAEQIDASKVYIEQVVRAIASTAFNLTKAA